MKKIISAFFVLILLAHPCSARNFEIDLNEKLGWVNVAYFEKFGDEYLTNYILQAVENNNSARSASFKSEEYRQNIKYVFGTELPRLEVGANYLGLKTPDNLTPGINKNNFIVPFIASYEVDLLQKNRDKTRSVKKDWEATKFDEQTAYIALASDVATIYTNILRYNKMIEVQRKIVDVRKEFFGRTTKQFEVGTTEYITYNNANKDLKLADADLENLLINRQKLLTQFATIIGESPDNAYSLKFGRFEDFGVGVTIPDKISSDAVFSRPDILAAESKLAKAKIDVRVARKEFLPRFDVAGILVFSTITKGSFFSWDSIFAALLAGATQDIFTGGKKVATLKMKKMQYEQMFEAYKQTDLTALQEINDALYLLKHDGEINRKTLERLSYEGDNFSRNRKKYEQGLASYPSLLVQNLTLLNAEKDLIDSRAVHIIDNFTLYKVVGGKL